jgi:hypothetical protein
MSDMTSFEDELSRRGVIIHTNKGESMMPLLREGRDVMIIKRPEGRLRRYDVALYKRADGTYILHRVLKVTPNGYVMCGDHCTEREYGITDNEVIGVLTGVIRDGKRHITTDNLSYKVYSHLWCDFFYIRALILNIKLFFARAFGYIRRKIRRK